MENIEGFIWDKLYNGGYDLERCWNIALKNGYVTENDRAEFEIVYKRLKKRYNRKYGNIMRINEKQLRKIIRETIEEWTQSNTIDNGMGEKPNAPRHPSSLPSFGPNAKPAPKPVGGGVENRFNSGRNIMSPQAIVKMKSAYETIKRMLTDNKLFDANGNVAKGYISNVLDQYDFSQEEYKKALSSIYLQLKRDHVI